VVATSFARHLDRTRDCFDRVVFAVYDRRAGTPAVQAFREVFS
jgi:hypothetical protein